MTDIYDLIDVSNVDKLKEVADFGNRSIKLRALSRKNIERRLKRLLVKYEKEKDKIVNSEYRGSQKKINEKLEKSAKVITRLENKIMLLSRDKVPSNFLDTRPIKLRDNMFKNLQSNGYAYYLNKANKDQIFSLSMDDVDKNVNSIHDKSLDNVNIHDMISDENDIKDVVTNAFKDVEMQNSEASASNKDNENKISGTIPKQVSTSEVENVAEVEDNDSIETGVISPKEVRDTVEQAFSDSEMEKTNSENKLTIDDLKTKINLKLNELAGEDDLEKESKESDIIVQPPLDNDAFGNTKVIDDSENNISSDSKEDSNNANKDDSNDKFSKSEISDINTISDKFAKYLSNFDTKKKNDKENDIESYVIADDSKSEEKSTYDGKFISKNETKKADLNKYQTEDNKEKKLFDFKVPKISIDTSSLISKNIRDNIITVDDRNGKNDNKDLEEFVFDSKSDNSNNEIRWAPGYTEEQILSAIGDGIDEPKGQEYEQWLKETVPLGDTSKPGLLYSIKNSDEIKADKEQNDNDLSFDFSDATPKDIDSFVDRSDASITDLIALRKKVESLKKQKEDNTRSLEEAKKKAAENSKLLDQKKEDVASKKDQYMQKLSFLKDFANALEEDNKRTRQGIDKFNAQASAYKKEADKLDEEVHEYDSSMEEIDHIVGPVATNIR